MGWFPPTAWNVVRVVSANYENCSDKVTTDCPAILSCRHTDQMFRAKLFDRRRVLVGHVPPVKDPDVAVLAGSADVEVVCRVSVYAVERDGTIGVAKCLQDEQGPYSRDCFLYHLSRVYIGKV